MSNEFLSTFQMLAQWSNKNKKGARLTAFWANDLPKSWQLQTWSASVCF